MPIASTSARTPRFAPAPVAAARAAVAPAPAPRAVVALSPGSGERIWFLDQLVVVKLRGADAPYGVIETALDKDRATPFHRHTDEDEALYVLEGELSIYVEGGTVLHGSPGTYVHVPRGVAHGFKTHTRVRMLVLSSPTGFVDFTRAYGAPAPRPGLPPPARPDLDRLQALAAKYHIELLGPLPEIC
jgi:quercetin dioxygenase-like cupin family protein